LLTSACDLTLLSVLRRAQRSETVSSWDTGAPDTATTGDVISVSGKMDCGRCSVLTFQFPSFLLSSFTSSSSSRSHVFSLSFFHVFLDQRQSRREKREREAARKKRKGKRGKLLQRRIRQDAHKNGRETRALILFKYFFS
jgi:hypothetical protein